MCDKTIKVNIDLRNVATLTLLRASKHNAMNSEMIQQIRQEIVNIKSNSNIRVVVLTGDGESFCSGGDLKWMKDQFEASRGQQIYEARELASMLDDINSLPVPVIARVNGQAYGGGIGLMSVADIVIAVDTAMFGLTEVKLGIIPATISPFVLSRMGESNARRVFFSGRLFGAEEARDLSLVSRVCSAKDLDVEIEKEIEPFLNASPEAIKQSKKLIKQILPQPTQSQKEITIELLADTWETKDAAEGVEAFFNKRNPYWKKK